MPRSHWAGGERLASSGAAVEPERGGREQREECDKQPDRERRVPVYARARASVVRTGDRGESLAASGAGRPCSAHVPMNDGFTLSFGLIVERRACVERW